MSSNPESADSFRPGGKPTPPAGAAACRDREGFNRFRHFLEGAAGISLSDDKGYLVSSRLAPIQRAEGCADLAELVTRLEHPTARELRARVVDAMTTNETLWFRDDHPFIVFKESVLPALAAAARPIRVWSSGCATGQEPYSLSICIEELQRERPGLLRVPVEIVATDISPTALAQARHAVYPEHVLRRGLSDARRRQFFEATGDGWRPRAEVRQRVQFRELNLLDSFALLGRFDVVLCRNVLIYFSSERRAQILARMAAGMSPGGWLLLGGTESLPGPIDGLSHHRVSRGVVYRRK